MINSFLMKSMGSFKRSERVIDEAIYIENSLGFTEKVMMMANRLCYVLVGQSLPCMTFQMI